MQPEALDGLVAAWSWFVQRSIFDGCVALCCVAILWGLVRRRCSPQVGYVLFVVVVAKTLLPFTLPLAPTGFGEPLALLGRSAPVGGDLGMPLMLCWSVIVCVWLTRFAFVQNKAVTILQGAMKVQDERVAKAINVLRLKANLPESVQVMVSDRARSPMVVGLLRPTVILPSAIAEQLTDRQLAWVIMHEFAHVRRKDLWVSLVQRVVLILQFYNPAVWLANWIINELREFACDDFALASTKVSRTDCGEGFLAVVELANGRPPATAVVMGMANDATQIRTRLVRLLDGGRRRPFGIAGVGAVFAMAVVLISLPTLRTSASAAQSSSIPRHIGTQEHKSRVQDEPRKSYLVVIQTINKLNGSRQEYTPRIERIRKESGYE